MTEKVNAKRAAIVCVDSWAGRTESPCFVVGETPKRYRIEVATATLLPKRPGWMTLQPGETRLVPKRAIRFIS